MAAEGHDLSEPGGKSLPVSEWPWTWLRAISYARKVRSVYERAAMDEEPDEAMPPRWMWFRSKDIDEWFAERREEQRQKHQSNG